MWSTSNITSWELLKVYLLPEQKNSTGICSLGEHDLGKLVDTMSSFFAAQHLDSDSRFLSAAEVQAHPEYPHVHWDLKPTKSEKINVASGRGGPFKLAYELHGHGPRKIIWIMGLGGFMKTWQRQTKDFGHTGADQYTCLVFDNRGMGESDKPLLRYTTSEMARDIVELLDHVGWTEERSVNVVGISMGGMIAQELVRSTVSFFLGSELSDLNRVSSSQPKYRVSTSSQQHPGS